MQQQCSEQYIKLSYSSIYIMKMEHLQALLFLAIVLNSLVHGGLVGGESVVTFHVSNKCPFPIWPASAPNAGHPVIGDGGGFFLPSGHVRRVEAPSDWNGRFWARTGCNFTTAPRPPGTQPAACQTGDCRGLLACNGTIGHPPATLLEVSLQPNASGRPSFYEVSVVDGYNVPVAVATKPANPRCAIQGCRRSVNSVCPAELQVVVSSSGADVNSSSPTTVVACKSACLAFDLDVFCCRNSHAGGGAGKCPASLYSKVVFKEACPSYVTFAYDTDPLVSCAADDYSVTFCPSKWGGGELTEEQNTYVR